MKSIVSTLLLFLISFPLVVYAKESGNTTIGVGAGFMYTGLGVNIGHRTDTSLLYLSLGCTSISSSSSKGTDTNCGLGGGWVSTDILNQTSNKHGLGLHLNLTHNNFTDDNEKSLGISYIYFFNGINNNGWNLGLSPTIEKRKGETDTVLFLQVGYQF